MNEIIFSYGYQRCHARIVDKLQGCETYIGTMEGYDIYKINGVFFNQFAYVAIKKGEYHES